MLLIVAGCGTGKESEYRSYSQAVRESAGDSSSGAALPSESSSGSNASPSIDGSEARRDSNDISVAGDRTTTKPVLSPEVVPSTSKPTLETTRDRISNAETQSTEDRNAGAKPQRENPQGSEAVVSKSVSAGKTASPSGADGYLSATTSNVVTQSSTGTNGRPPVVALRPGEKPQPREVKLLVPFKDFRKEGPEDAIRVSYDDIDLLKVLNMEPVTPEAPKLMPSWMKELDGKRIRIRGFMYPPHAETGLEHFVLARDNQICCFGRDPKIYDVFGVKLREGVTTDYIQSRPFDVVGVFHIVPDAIDGDLIRLYEIDDAVVIEKIK